MDPTACLGMNMCCWAERSRAEEVKRLKRAKLDEHGVFLSSGVLPFIVNQGAGSIGHPGCTGS